MHTYATCSALLRFFGLNQTKRASFSFDGAFLSDAISRASALEKGCFEMEAKSFTLQ